MKDVTLQRNNTRSPCETGSTFYMEKLTFGALIKYIFKKLQNIRFRLPKNFISTHMKLCSLNADQNWKVKSVIALV